MNIKENYFIRFLRNHWIILLISLLNFIITFIPNLFGFYELFRDELYYIACSKRLAFGYYDHPPFATFLLSIIRLFFGDSILAIRFLPILVNTLLIFIAGIITKKLGGKKFAQGIACLSVSICPFYLILNSFYSMNSFESLLLTCCVLILIIIIQEDKNHYWLLWGLITGIGLINKHTFAVYEFAILIGMTFTPLRKYFFDKYFWLGIFISIVIILPNVIWQIQNDFISAAYYKNIIAYNSTTLPLTFIIMQIIALNPLVFPVCLLGIIFLFLKTEGKPYRVFGWMFLISFFYFLFMKVNRPDRLAPVYPILMSGGSIMAELWINKINRNWIKHFIIAILIIGGIISFSLFLQILPPEILVRYNQTIGLSNQGIGDIGEEGIRVMPIIGQVIYHQMFCDRLGWKSMATDVATVYNKMSDQDKKEAVIFAANYGEASAIEFYGSQYNLPTVISTHYNYWLWGFNNATGDLMISIGYDKEILDIFFEKVEETGIIHTCDYCMDNENNLPIYICRKIKIPMKELWRITKPTFRLKIDY
jgi:hypothetical protein